MTDLYFEDFSIGQTFDAGSYTLGEEEAVAFGARYVPMPFHVDREKANASPYRGLIVPGHLSAAIVFGLFAKLGLLYNTGMGAPGMDVRWVRPVRPGDTLRVAAKVTELSPAKAPGKRDAIRLRLDAFNQKDELVLVHETWQFVRRRDATA